MKILFIEDKLTVAGEEEDKRNKGKKMHAHI